MRAHSETVLRCFYEFHLEAGSGPVINPFPLDRARRGGRAHAHHNPMEPFRNERAGLYRPRVPSRVPRSVPDEEFNEIFARLPSHRDRALVAFYVSTGARASELLSATLAGVDPGRQVITVVRKGTRELQELPASTDAFVWLRLYQVEMEGLIPQGRRQPLWWTLRRPVRPLTYHAVHRMFERAGAGGRQQRDAAFAAPHRRLPDGRGPGAAADRRAARPRPCAADDHADLPDAPQGRGDPPGPGPSCRADPAGRRAGAPGAGSRLPARDDGGAVREPDAVTEVDHVPRDRVSSRPRPSASRRAQRFPPRPVATDWPATRQERGEVFERLTSGIFVLANADSQERRRRGLAWLLDWLADQPGQTWQQRWMASGADAAGGDWRQVPIAWQREHGRESRWLRR